MDLQQLKHCLAAAGVPEDGYLLVGLDAPRALREGACIVRPNQRSWEVFIWRPVRVEPSFTFLNEDEACEHALDTLTSAITTSAKTAPAGSVPAGSVPAGSVPARSVPARSVAEGAASRGAKRA